MLSGRSMLSASLWMSIDDRYFAMITNRSKTEWGLIMTLFRATVAHPKASQVTLELVGNMARGTVGTRLSADNFTGFVGLFDEFATAAGAAASRHQGSRAGPSASTPTSL